MDGGSLKTMVPHWRQWDFGWSLVYGTWSSLSLLGTPDLDA